MCVRQHARSAALANAGPQFSGAYSSTYVLAARLVCLPSIPRTAVTASRGRQSHTETGRGDQMVDAG